MTDPQQGVIYLCPTPVGNLNDITLRVIDTLKSADMAAAEDTRQTLKLLNRYDIQVPLMSYHKYNIRHKTDEIIAMVESGKTIAVVSDAGSPGISDPGEELVRVAIQKGIRVVSLPGPTAFVPALTASGLTTKRFCFDGFLPRKKSERIKRLKDLQGEERTMVFYEAPHRLVSALEDMLNIFGNRKICVARELTKKFEEYYRGDIESAISKFKLTEPRGEFTLVVEGCSQETVNGYNCENLNEQEITKRILELIEQGMHKNDAIKRVSESLGVPRRDVYRMAIKLKLPPPLDN